MGKLLLGKLRILLTGKVLVADEEVSVGEFPFGEVMTGEIVLGK